jgi:type IV pilus assembly protein PilC
MSLASARTAPAALSGATSRSRLSEAQTAQFFEMLQSLSGAGISMVKALDGLSESEEFSEPLSQTVRALEAGHSLSRSFARGGFCDPLIGGLLQLGETTGTMDKAIAELARVFRWRAQLAAELKSRLTYPVILAVACALLVGLGPPLLLQPILQFLTQSGAALPWATRAMLMLVDLLGSPLFWICLLGGVLLCWRGATAFFRSHPAEVESWLLERRLLGRPLALLSSLRFARALQSGLGTGYPLLQGIELAARCSGSHRMKDDARIACALLIAGVAPEDVFRAFTFLDPLIRTSITLGLATGAPDTLIGAVARLQEEQLRQDVEKALVLLEPILLGFMGIMVGACVLATVSPMLTLLQGVT